MFSPAEQEALAAAREGAATPAQLAKLTKRFGPELAIWASEQVQLQAKGLSKFARAAEMRFTKSGVEMSTHEAVSAWRARQFPVGCRITDLCCGIGGDLISLAENHEVVGVDLDAATVEAAQHNLEVYQRRAEVICGDALHHASGEYLFIDPARRNEKGRIWNPTDYEPNPETIKSLCSGAKRVGFKLSPLLRDDWLEAFAPRIEFLSHQGECCEAVAWLGSEVEPGRFAVRVEGDLVAPESPLFDQREEPLSFLMEADPALIRAHSLGVFQGMGVAGLGDSNGYLTSEQQIASPWLKGYEVKWSGPWHEKHLRREVANRGLSAVKKRLVDVDPARILKTFGGWQKEGFVLILYPVGKSIRAALCDPIRTQTD